MLLLHKTQEGKIATLICVNAALNLTCETENILNHIRKYVHLFCISNMLILAVNIHDSMYSC